MRVKEIDRTANVAWSPSEHHPIYLAAGTAAQQLDATFSTTAALELFSLNLSDSDNEMPVVTTVPSDCRFHKLLWGCHGMTPSSDNVHSVGGIIVAGTDDGSIIGWDPAKLLNGDPAKDAVVFKQDKKHIGSVKALGFNNFQSNLLASGGSDSEIFIWDLNNSSTPMAPGTKSQPPEDVACVAWNLQVQHILASTFTARCVVWDLRKSEPIIKISDSMSRIKSKLVAWHPEVATQLCLSSEDDHTPVIQLWDLRFASSPLKQLEKHERGILSLAWCPRDPDLLLSCGKDNRILCWNPNSQLQGGEVIYELPTSSQWCFDVQWCPRNPNIISSASFDGHITIHSLMGGGQPIQPSNRIAESFNSLAGFGQTMAHVPVAVPEEQKPEPLKKPPKWLIRPVGASFAFGGKLISFETTKPANPQQPIPKSVYISQVVTEPELVIRSNQLEQALVNNQFLEFCAMKIANSADPFQENIWNFLRVNFEKEPRAHYLHLLGYDQTELATKVAEHTGDTLAIPCGVDASELAQKMSLLSAVGLDSPLQCSGQASPAVGSKPSSRDELSDASAAFDEIAVHTQQEEHQHKRQRSDTSGIQTPLIIPAKTDPEGLMTEALLTGNFEAAVEMCLHDNNMAEAILLAIAGGPDLLASTQKKFFQKNKSRTNKLVSCILNRNWTCIIDTCDLANWREALAVIMTYASNDEFAQLCDKLGSRLESEQNGNLSSFAILCYVCSGNVNKMVENWMKNTSTSNSPKALQDLVEKVMVLRRVVVMTQGADYDAVEGALAEHLTSYSKLLAAQGSLTTAMNYLGTAQESSLSILRDRLYHALGDAAISYQPPCCPFNRLEVRPAGAVPTPTASTVQQTIAGQHLPYQQSQARGTFQTTTTPSIASQYSQVQYTGGMATGAIQSSPTAASSVAPGFNIPNTYPVSSTGYAPVATPAYPASSIGYTPATAPTSMPGPASAPSAFADRPRHPSYPQSAAAYGLDTVPQPSPYIQPDYSQQTPYTQSAYSAYSGVGHAGGYHQPPVSQPSSNIYNLPTSQPQGYSGGEIQPHHPSVSSYQAVKPHFAWNDPPTAKDKKQGLQYDAPLPITSPIYGQAPVHREEQPPPGAPMNYGQFYNPAENAVPPQQPIQVAEPAMPVAKAPIPSEHAVLKEIFDTLTTDCLNRAANAQMKRKMEDVTRKMDSLYDLLRDSSLSDAVTLGLHQIIQAIQQYDYQTSLTIHTEMVSHGNFSEISSFMPSLKVLLQTAMHLQVFIQQ